MAVLMRPHEKSSRRGVLALLAFGLAVACATLVPQQGWNPSAGPVVPHDSFPADCSLCHVGDDWHTLRADFSFDHDAKTGVALLGAHTKAPCLLCHNDRGPVATFAARGCGGCHADPHQTRLGANCADCHDERTWYPREAIARHDRTSFPLVGAHAAAACFRCHPGAPVGNFAGASRVCFACHQDEYAATTDPDHEALSFSQDCERCHLPLGWRPSRFDHPASFPLTLGHAGRLCVECHTTPGVFTGLSTACASCHFDDYQATTNPPHVAFQMSLQCQECHTTASWPSGNFVHQFPITSGKHRGFSCFTCHNNPVNRIAFSCIDCHEHRQTAMNSEHQGVGGYVWASPNCYACHPDGRN
jgi:hypothetical protein